MKVIHVITSLALGGGEEHLLRLINQTDDLDHAVCFLGMNRALRREFSDAGVEVVDLGYDQPRDLPFALFRMYKLLRSADPDIVHLHLIHAIVLGRLIGRLARVDNIISTQQNVSQSYPLFWGYLERFTRGLEDQSVAVSRAVLDSFANRSDDHWSVIYNGIDVESFRRKVSEATSFQTNDFTLLNIGRYHKQKNQSYLINSLAELKRTTTSFKAYIVGWGELEEDLKSLVNEKGLEDEVEITGKSKNVEKYYNSADIFVLTSNYEGLPLTATEAMSAGLPIIGTDVAGIKEVVDDGGTGYLVPNNDEGALVNALSKIADPETRRKMGKQSYDKAREKFDISETSTQYVRLYEELSATE
ncbi:Glycosyltransferase involved in cell wall bisynthesis [Halovenus aranensis]|uniref:Glycosyltransferase involved in cell wall bisynthesis n=1 Tax=Halovenus aranensis TaxID=890420 RepID=A0A1G8ZXZ6_9EURY|nr:glycosyltransferase [Halovenus aranensis]SDK20012.1 Glycosyltransferase involved in cell wall bisynthesis [Halovenus aranensis]